MAKGERYTPQRNKQFTKPTINKLISKTMSLQVIMSAAVENGIRNASVDFAIGVINQLSKEGALSCSVDEAIRMFDFDGVKVASRRSAAVRRAATSSRRSPRAKAGSARPPRRRGRGRSRYSDRDCLHPLLRRRPCSRSSASEVRGKIETMQKLAK